MTRSTALLAALAFGCAFGTTGVQPRGLPGSAIPIDLARFAGEWIVIAHIPTATEAEAHEAIERYALRDDGGIDVGFRFCEGSLEGPARELTMRAWVHDASTNAEWRVRPWWPLRLRYQILELDPDYRRTVVASPGLGFAWIMAREPGMQDAELDAIAGRLAEQGYDTSQLRRVPFRDGRCGEASRRLREPLYGTRSKVPAPSMGRPSVP